jgi:hypothetical protein
MFGRFKLASALVLALSAPAFAVDLSRENIVKQARNIRDLVLPTLIPGILVTPVPTTATRTLSCNFSVGRAIRGSSSAAC